MQQVDRDYFLLGISVSGEWQLILDCPFKQILRICDLQIFGWKPEMQLL